MRITIAGGTGFIGTDLSRRLIEVGHDVTVLSRDPSKARRKLPASVAIEEWNGASSHTLQETLTDTDAIINLCGEPIADGRWSDSRKQMLLASRIDSTRHLVDTFEKMPNPPKTLICASGVGFYGVRNQEAVTEQSRRGEGFMADLCEAWEREAKRGEEFGVRVIHLRIGMVLGKSGGALAKMLLPFKLFLGGPILPGTQKVSWIHQDDLSQMIIWLLETPEITGPVNAVAPYSVDMKEFCQTLAHALNRPSWLPVPSFVLKLVLGELATVLTTGQAVKPVVAEEKGFSFSYPTLDKALQSIFRLKQLG